MTMERSGEEPVTLRVPDLAEAIEYFTGRLGFRLEMIMPADAPCCAVLSGQTRTFRIEAPAQQQQGETNGWRTGRAGMQYRDLIPGRLGGAAIASQIRIPAGGAVPDYVHYHRVRFQMIYCRAGWVRVVYEDQGPPFVLEAGDCVLQPPGIRHRVLEASPGLEVIEIGAPAEHETFVDHALSLPTGRLAPERRFGGQRFVRHRARDAAWRPWRLDGVASRDTGIAAATDDLADVRVVRASREIATTLSPRASECLIFFVLQGELGLNGRRAPAGEGCGFAAGTAVELRAATETEWLQVALLLPEDERSGQRA